MDVFIGYDKSVDPKELGATLEAWEEIGAEPSAVECEPNKVGIKTCLVAENICVDPVYIISELGCIPVEKDFLEKSLSLMDKNAHLGLIATAPKGKGKRGFTMEKAISGVLICRRAAVQRWVQPRTSAYMSEHAESYLAAGYKTAKYWGLHYERINSH